jgi:hypothetical protein
MLSHFWRAAREIDPSVADEQPRAGVREGDLVDRFGRAGLQGVTGGTLETSVDYADFDDYWEPFAGAAGPATGAFYASLDDAQGDPARHRARLPAQRPVHAARAPGSRWEPFRAKGAARIRPGGSRYGLHLARASQQPSLRSVEAVRHSCHTSSEHVFSRLVFMCETPGPPARPSATAAPAPIRRGHVRRLPGR